MPLTVADLERMLLRRTRKYLVRAELDATTANGTNADLRDPLYAAAYAVGLSVADSVQVIDDEVATLAGFVREKFLDVAELHLLQIVWGNWAEWDQTAGEESQSLNQLTKDLQARIDWLSDKVARPYGTTETTGGIPGPAYVTTIAAGRCYPRSPRPWDYAAWRACP